MVEINLKTILKRNAQVRYTIVPEGGLVVLHETGEILTLNPIGIEILDKLDGKKRVQDVLKEIIKNYEVEEKIAERDLLDYLKELLEKKIVEFV